MVKYAHGKQYGLVWFSVLVFIAGLIVFCTASGCQSQEGASSETTQTTQSMVQESQAAEQRDASAAVQQELPATQTSTGVETQETSKAACQDIQSASAEVPAQSAQGATTD